MLAMQQDLKRQLSSGNASEEAIQAFLLQKTPVLTEALWKQNVVDIENTVTAVVEAVLADPRVSKDVLVKRAKGLKKLGVIFEVGGVTRIATRPDHMASSCCLRRRTRLFGCIAVSAVSLYRCSAVSHILISWSTTCRSLSLPSVHTWMSNLQLGQINHGKVHKQLHMRTCTAVGAF